MLTTPVPTTAAAHLGLVGALREIARETADYSALGKPARAALEGWEKRPRLRNQPGLHKALATLLDCHRGPWTEDDRGIVLDVFDGLLFGTGPRTGGGG